MKERCTNKKGDKPGRFKLIDFLFEQKGTQNHYYSISDFVKRYRKHFDDKGALDILK